MGKERRGAESGTTYSCWTPDLTSSASPLFYQAPALFVPGTWQLPRVDRSSVCIGAAALLVYMKRFALFYYCWSR